MGAGTAWKGLKILAKSSSLIGLVTCLASDVPRLPRLDFDIACYERERESPPVRQALAHVCRTTDRVHLFVSDEDRAANEEMLAYSALVTISKSGRAVWLTGESDQQARRQWADRNYFSLDVDFAEAPPLGEAQLHAVFSRYPLSKEDVQRAVAQGSALGVVHVSQTIWWVDEPT